MKEDNATPEGATPAEWPGAFGIYKSSRDAIRQNLATVIMLWLIPLALSIFLEIMLGASDHGPFVGVAARQLLTWVVGIYLATAQTHVYISAVRRKRVAVNDALSFAGPLFWRMLLLNLLVIVSVVGGLILLIVPGIIVALRLSLAQYYLVDQNLSVMEAYKASWNATKGNLGKLWGIIGVSFLMALPVITIIGIIATAYLLLMYSAATAFLYIHLSGKIADAPEEIS